MKKSAYQNIVILLFTLLTVSLSDLGAQTYRILPLGNSITQGWGSLPLNMRVSYRLQLQDDMIASGYSIDFIGHQSSGSTLMTDVEHCGIPDTHDHNVLRLLQDGWDIINNLQTTLGSQPYLNEYPADIILLHIGTNDVLNGEGPSEDTISQILDEIDAWEATNGSPITVFVAGIVNTFPNNPDITQFNLNVATMVTARNDPSIIMVDMESGAGILYGADFEADGIHLLQSGYDKMGIAWHTAIDAYLSNIPDAPSNITFGTVFSSTIELSWTINSSNETGFEIERSLTPNSGDFVFDGSTSAGIASYQSSGLDANTLYYYRVRAINATGPSGYSAIENTTTLPIAPLAPGSLTFDPVTSSSIRLNWVDNSLNEDGFEIYRSLSSGGTYTLIETTVAGITTYNHTGLNPVTDYFYRIYAVNTGGSSLPLSGSATTLPLAPAAPGSLTFDPITSSSIRLNWVDNSLNEDGFEIYRSLSSGGTYTLIETTGAGITTYNHIGLNDNTNYFYRVYAVNAGGSSLPLSGSATTLPIAPLAPGSLTFDPVTSSSIRLNWVDNSLNEDGFEIHRSFTSGGTYTLIETTVAGITTYNHTGLNPVTDYFYRVYAVNTGGSSLPLSGSATTLPLAPAAPGSLTFDPITSASIRLNWVDNSLNEDGFEIHRSFTSGGVYTLVGITGVGITTYNHTALVPNTNYFYRVYAVNAGGSSLPLSGSATTLPIAPLAPGSLTFDPITSSSIRLNWVDNSLNEDGFEIYRSLSSGGTYTLIETTIAGITTYNHTGLNPVTDYFYRIYAVNTGGSSLPLSGSATTLPLAPAAPGSLTFDPITSSSIRLNWVDNSLNEDGFEIYRSLSLGGPYTLIETTGAGITTYNHIGLNDNTDYFYRVYAVNAGGSSLPVSGNTTTLPLAPVTPGSLTFDPITSSSIRLNWVDNSLNEDGFEIHRSFTSGGVYTLVGTTGVGITTFNNTALVPNTDYFYRVYAVNSGGSSLPLSGTATTLPLPPAAPSSLNFAPITATSIQLNWADNSSNEDGFEIRQSLTFAGPYTLIETTEPNITNFNNTGLTIDTEYFYRVNAVNAGGASSFIIGSAQTLMNIPGNPTKLDGIATSICSVNLTWDDRSTNEDGFEIERSTLPSSGFVVIQTVPTNIESYTDPTTENNTIYYYRIRAFNAAGYSDYTSIVLVVVSINLNGGTIGVDQIVCPNGDPDRIINLISPSGGSNNWSYQWQSRIPPGIFEDVAGATLLTYDPPAGMIQNTDFQRISTVECGSVPSNIVAITAEDTENPVFTTCPDGSIITIERNETSTTLATQDPVVSDNCEIALQTWVLSGSTIGASPLTGINYLGTYDFNLGVTTVTYHIEDLSGNIAECLFDISVEFNIPEILSVSIPDATMKIEDVVSATITVSDDGGTPFNMVSGSIGGYPLYNFQQVDATTYLANFDVVEGGNSYLASENIPVVSLVISDGIDQSLPYNLPITQANDLLDAELPVISSINAVPGIYGVGDIVILNISSDGLNYELDPTTVINDIPESETNVTLSELGGGNYQLHYTVEEGNLDVAPGELLASVTLVRPSGNIGLPFSDIGFTDLVTIDAHAPILTRLEVEDIEVGVGGTVQVTITADGEGYTAAIGTLINGIPLSSSQVSFSERTGGLYEMSYVVALLDASVAPGDLAVQMVLMDSAGNTNEPFILVESNTLEVYTELPIALLAGVPEICEGETVELTVFLEGREPWSIDLNNGDSITTFKDITTNVFNITVIPDHTTSYQVDTVRDVNGVVNVGSGNVPIKVNEKTNVEIINLASGYSYEADPVKLEADVTGGTFSGPGVFSGTGFFDPGVADTVNSPHTIYYTFINSNGCESIDSALVFVLGADGGIYIPSSLVCDNGDPFLVHASNITGVDGSFRLLNSDGQPVEGLTDNGDNSAEINPQLLAPGEYTIEYEYVDQVSLYLRRTFVVETVSAPAIINLDDSYCQNVAPFVLEADIVTAIFEGQGVTETDSGYIFNPAEVVPGDISIICMVTSENGCVASTQKIIEVLFTPDVDFTLSTTCIPDTGGTVVFDNMTSGKLEVEFWNWDFGDPSSGDDNQSDLIAPDHYYSTPGERSIGLTATAFNGCVSDTLKNVIIGNQVLADFTWSSDCHADDVETEFLDRSISGSSGIDTLIWKFKTSGGSILDELGTEPGSDPVSYQFESDGSYLVELIAINAFGCSDSVTAELNLRKTIQLSSAGYMEAFNLNDGEWTIESGDQVESWTWDTPDFIDFEQVSGDRAWYTQLPDQVNYRENSWIQSPCFDFQGIKRPMITLDIMRSFVPGKDGAVLQYQESKAEGWKTVGGLNSGLEWYSHTNLTNEPGEGTIGWGLDVFLPDSKWISAVHDLDALSGKSNVTLRLAIGTNEAGGGGNQGFAFDNVSITERTKITVLEHFTNSSDASSRTADDVIDSFGSENTDEVVDIQYHMDYPGSDPMNENSPVSSSARAFNYGIQNVPYAVLDGGISEEFRFDFSELKTTPSLQNLTKLTLPAPVFDVELFVEWMDGSLEATTIVTCNVDHYAENIQLYVVVFETSVTAYTGINGDTEFRNVVLDMLPTPAGKLLGDNWYKGNNDIRINSWTYLPYVENVDDLAVVVFVQDRNSKQILQAAVDYKTPLVGIEKRPFQVESLFIYPNPAKTVVNVNLGRASEADGRFEIIDMNGRIVLNENVPAGYQIYQLEVRSLNRGFYLVQWYEGGVLKSRNKLVTVD